MLTRLARFNLYLPSAAGILILAGFLSAGCSTFKQGPGKSDEITTLHFHLEVSPNQVDHTQKVPIYRANPQLVNIDTSIVINENDVATASVDGTNGLFAIKLDFTRHGAIGLNTLTPANKVARQAVSSHTRDARAPSAP